VVKTKFHKEDREYRTIWYESRMSKGVFVIKHKYNEQLAKLLMKQLGTLFGFRYVPNPTKGGKYVVDATFLNARYLLKFALENDYAIDQNALVMMDRLTKEYKALKDQK